MLSIADTHPQVDYSIYPLHARYVHMNAVFVSFSVLTLYESVHLQGIYSFKCQKWQEKILAIRKRQFKTIPLPFLKKRALTH